MGRVVVWFKNDLRLHDNCVVSRAGSLIASGEAKEVVPVYCFDPRHYVTTPWGNPKTGNFRAKFLLESVLDLKESLRRVDSDLIIKYGQPEDILPGLLGNGPAKVLTQEEFAFEELGTMAKVKRAVSGKAGLEQFWDGTLHHRSDLPYAEDLHDLQDVFTPFRNKVESRCEPRKLVRTPQKGQLPLPADLDEASLNFAPSRVEDLNKVVPEGAPRLSTPQEHPNAVLSFKGGETEALKRVKHYLWDTDCVADYFNTRNGMLGGDYSTKFSPWLAHGCVSPRHIFHELAKYESQRQKNKSTYWVVFELLWRDYFRFFTLKHGSSIFFEGGTIGKRVEWNHDEELFRRWRDGMTGMPLVDANMRELKQTGFMSNRGRQNVASYLVLDLGIDWRKGADWFESVLADYDVASNWGNWVSAAGLTGGRVNHFNITKQSKDYDEQGLYVKTWVPELANVPQHKVHEPWHMTKEEQASCAVHISQDYPYPPKSRYTRDAEGRGNGGGRRGGRRGGSRGGQGQRPGGRGRGERKGGGDFDRYG